MSKLIREVCRLVNTELALITCPHTKRLINVDALAKCFSDDNTFLCSKTLLNTVNEVTWLGFPWHPDRPLTFPRHHVAAQDCSNLHPLLHLGGRYYLSTTSQAVATSNGPLQLLPLMIYHFPYNTTFPDMVTGLGTYPHRMTLTVPVFSRDTLKYTPWTPTDNDTLIHISINQRHSAVDLPSLASGTPRLIFPLQYVVRHLHQSNASTTRPGSRCTPCSHQVFCLLQTGELGSRLPCCHKHSHESCLARWFDRVTTCPFCRTPLTPVALGQPVPRTPVGLIFRFHTSAYSVAALPQSSPSSPPPLPLPSPDPSLVGTPRQRFPIDWVAVRAHIPDEDLHRSLPPNYHPRPG